LGENPDSTEQVEFSTISIAGEVKAKIMSTIKSERKETGVNLSWGGGLRLANQSRVRLSTRPNSAGASPSSYCSVKPVSRTEFALLQFDLHPIVRKD
jgi:hypothetical protein